ncbi:MAG: hypothetical protein IPM40_16520 [Gammaproteobacteria bacterium]|nr:hypothetical protein [Gammaproteobacteria bacterium]
MSKPRRAARRGIRLAARDRPLCACLPTRCCPADADQGGKAIGAGEDVHIGADLYQQQRRADEIDAPAGVRNNASTAR